MPFANHPPVTQVAALSGPAGPSGNGGILLESPAASFILTEDGFFILLE